MVERFVAWAERDHRRILAALVALELVLGFAYAAHLGSELRYWDEREYMQLATSLLERHEYRFTSDLAFRPPLYPMVLAAARFAGANVLALRLLNFGFLAVAMILLDRLATALAGPLAGLFAAALAFVNPVMFYTAGTLYPQTLAGCLLLGFVALVAREPPRSLYGAGLCFALLALTVPSFVPLLFVTVFWIGYVKKESALRAALELGAGAVVPIAAWTLRNHHVLGSWVFVATNSGLNLLYGNSENATPSSGVNADISRYLTAAAGLGEVERDRYYREMALRWIAGNPGRALELYLGKLVHYFSSNDRLATAGEGSSTRTAIATVAYLPLLLTLLVRPLLLRRYPPKPLEILLFLLYLANALLAAVFFTRVRLRLPADFLVLVLLAGLAQAWLGSYTRRPPGEETKGAP